MDINVERFRNAITKTTKLVAGEGLNVTQTGVTPFVRMDPRTGKTMQLNLPAIPDGSPRELMDAVQGYVDHEVAHTFYTDNKKAEAWAKPHVDGGRNKDLVHGLLNVVEDVRIERLIAREYRGAEANLNKAREYVSSSLPSMLEKQKMEYAMQGREFGDTDVGMFYLPTFMRALAGQRASIDLMNDQNLWEKYEPLRDAYPELEEELKAAETPEDVFAITERFLSLFDDNTPPPPQDQDGEGEGEGDSGDEDEKKDQKSKPNNDKSGDDGDDGNSSGDEDGDEEDEDGGDGGSDDQDDSQDGNEDGNGGSGGQDGDDQNDQQGDQNQGDQGGDQNGSSSPQKPSRSNADENGTPGGVGGIDGLLKESDAPQDFGDAMKELIKDRTIEAFEDAEGPVEFKRGIDKDRPLEVPRGGLDVSGVEEKVTQTVGAMQKELQRVIAARSLSVKSPGLRSGKLHGPSLHRLMRNDDRVFYRKQENRSNDVAVSLLIDCSGSMSGREIEVAGQAAWAFAEVLERIGVKSEINGFSTCGYYDDDYAEAERGLNQFMEDTKGEIDRGRIRTLGSTNIPFKSFEERFGRGVKERLAMTQSGRLRGMMQGNCDYIAVRQALFRLAVRKETRKILFVFSDGYPACSLAPDVGAKALKDEVAQAPKFGVETIGIGICSDSVEHFYPNHAVINNVGELPSVTMSHLRRMLLK